MNSVPFSNISTISLSRMNDVMYQLYQLTRDADHLTMAHLFDKQSWFSPIINNTDILANHHANTHLALTVGGNGKL